MKEAKTLRLKKRETKQIDKENKKKAVLGWIK